jgi:pilus assembly protein TadC
MEIKNLIRFCNISIFVVIIYGILEIINLTGNIINFSNSNFAFYDLIADISIIILIIVCCVMFLLLSKNVKAGKVLVIQNEKIIKISYLILGFTGILELIVASSLSDKGILYFNGIIASIIVALVLKFFEFIMRIARKMKEDIDLTV